MTEDEAKTKWCPFVRISDIDGALNNRCNPVLEQETSISQSCSCIGSQCMAWREDLTLEEASNGWKAAGGHCGLAGNP